MFDHDARKCKQILTKRIIKFRKIVKEKAQNLYQSLQIHVMDVINPTNLNPSNPQLQLNAKIEKALQQKCKIHKQNNADFLHLKSNVSNARICNVCVSQNNILDSNYLKIRDIFLPPQNNYLSTYPVLDATTQFQLRQAIQSNLDVLDSVKQSIDGFFSQLSDQIKDSIQLNKENQKLKLIQFEGIQQDYVDCWKEVADIENLQLILCEDNNEGQLVEFINNHISNSENNTLKIKSIYEEFLAMRNAFSTERPHQTQDIINSLLKEINFFDRSPFINDEGNNFRSEIKKKQAEMIKSQIQMNSSKISKKDQKNVQEQKSFIGEQLEQNRNLAMKIVDHTVKITELRNELQKKLQEVDQLQLKLSVCNKQIQETQVKIEQLQSQQNNLPWIGSDQMLEINKELHSFKSTDLLPGTKLILGKLQSSKNFSVTKKNQQELVFKNDTQNDCGGFSYLNFILNPQTNYVVQIKLEQTSGQSKYFWFGLLPDSVKDNTGGLNGELKYCEYQQDDSDLNTVLMGKDVRTVDNSLEKRSLEMRINIRKQILRVGSLPNYESVIQIDDPKKIKLGIPYRFFLWGLNNKTMISITKLETVSEFDDLM